MKKTIKLITIIIFVYFILPNMVFASWWNPFSWNIFNKKVVIQKEILDIKTDIIGDDIKLEINDLDKNNKKLVIKKDVSFNKTEEIRKDISIVNENPITTTLVATTSSSTVIVSTSTMVVVKFDNIVPILNKKAPGNFSDIFTLHNSDTEITLQQALIYAIKTGKITGVRPALILAFINNNKVIAEKNNTELCYLDDIKTGSTVSKKGNYFKKGIKPDRDIIPFLEITKTLGKDYLDTLISCPSYDDSYGGTIGPFQFLPSTWYLYINRLQTVLGHYPDPWNPEDSFVAVGFYLKDLGADVHTYTNELDVACKIWSGKICDPAIPSGILYANSIIKIATTMQTYVDYFDIE